MSLAMIYNEEKLKEIYPKLIGWQISNIKRMIEVEDAKISKAHQIKKTFESVAQPTKQNQIDLQYANADEKRALETKERLEGRLEVLMRELYGIRENAEEEQLENYVE